MREEECLFRRILVPIDGSPTSVHGLEAAIALAKDQGARVCLLHVVDAFVVTQSFEYAMYVPAGDVDRFVNALREEGRRLLAKAAAKLRRRRIEGETVLLETLGRRAAELIVKQATKWHADVIVLGTHGRRGLSRVLMGSDAEMVVREAPVPVLLVRSKRRSHRRSARPG